MRFAKKGILMGLTFTLTYFLSNYEALQPVFARAGQYAHVAKAAFLFTIGYAGGFLFSKMKS